MYWLNCVKVLVGASEGATLMEGCAETLGAADTEGALEMLGEEDGEVDTDGAGLEVGKRLPAGSSSFLPRSFRSSRSCSIPK